MNQKFVCMLGSAAVFHLAIGSLLLVSGCAQEDPPMPPGIYVPKHGNALPGRPQEGNNANVEKAVSPESTLEPQTAAPQQSPSATVTDTASKPAAAEAPAKKVEPSEDGKEQKTVEGTAYKVVKGDSLWRLSRKFKVTLEDLAVFNGIAANSKLRIGQVLMIPPAGHTVTAASPKAQKVVPVKRSGKKSAVKKSTSGKKKAAAKAEKKAVKRATAALPADGIYTVKSGDNFTVIARRFGLRVSDIQKAHPGVNSGRLKIGQKLQLSSGSSAAVSTAAVADSSAPEKSAAKDSKKDDSSANADGDNMDKLLDAVKTPAADSNQKPAQTSAAAAENATTAPAPADTLMGNDKNEFVKLDDGTTAVRLKIDMTLTEFCNMYGIKKDKLIPLNPTLPFDENLKSGLLIKVP